MSFVKVRLADPRDLEALVDLRAALWPEGSRDDHRREVRPTLEGQAPGLLPVAIFVAEDADGLTGFVEVGLRSHADGCDPARPCGFLEGWYVRPEASRQGVGRALVERAEQWALGQGCTEMASDTWAENEAGRRAHEALGFEVVDQCVNYRKGLAEPGAAATSATPLYGADLARVHHQHFGATAEAAARELLGRLSARGVSSGTVVDLAAGSGILARRALEAGFDVLGVDLSPDMLELARSHAPGGRFIEGSLWDADLPPAVAVTAIGEAFNYSTEALTPSLEGLEERLTAIARVLAPGGLLLFDLAGPGRSGVGGTRRRFWNEGGTVLLMEEVDDKAGHLTRRIETFVPVGTLHRRATETHRLVLFPPEDVAAALDQAGFSVERLDTYPGFPPLPGWSCFAATRRLR